jgi:hypothetical protein
MSSIAAWQESLDRIVVTGFNLSDLTWAVENGSWFAEDAFSKEAELISGE